MKEGLADVTKEVRRGFKWAFEKLDSIEESADRLKAKEVKTEAVIVLVGSDSSS